MINDQGETALEEIPMTRVDGSETKKRWTELLGRVARGERILITDGGHPVAMLVPPEPENRRDVAAVVREMLAARDDEGPALGKDLTARQMREEGWRP
jgi:prevent-host-death family protein